MNLRSTASSGLAGQGAGKTGITGCKALQLLKLEIQRLALLQHAGDHGQRGTAGGQSGGLWIAHRACLEQALRGAKGALADAGSSGIIALQQRGQP
jgi:hypothetical protein